MSTYQQRNTDVGEKVDNATEGGRYGSADAEEPHLTPEIIPRTLRREYAANVPDSIPGALPENGGFDDSPGKPTEE